jgi:NAD(P)-dependent dehydrogenase (short-subunit alcohol dehydrogenase family)
LKIFSPEDATNPERNTLGFISLNRDWNVRMTNKIFDKKIAVVTGGRTGIGAAMCERFGNLGATVISLDLYQDFEAGWNSKKIILNLACDVTDEASIKSAFDHIQKNFMKVDLLCVNAGIVPDWNISAETPIEVWNKVLQVNVIGAAMTLKHSARLLSAPGGSVLFTGSINSWKGDGKIAPYVASKHAILGIIKSAAIELGANGIRVNGIGPGPIATDALLQRVRNRTSGDEILFNKSIESLKSATALKRMATVNEVVNTAEFLLSDFASGITGQLITVDCGIL